MNKKLTLSLDKGVIEKAKTYAKENDVSLSFLVEEYFEKLISEYSKSEACHGSIVKELSGIINLENVDYKEDHSKYLEEKYK